MCRFVIIGTCRSVTLSFRSYISNNYTRATNGSAIIYHETAATLRIARSNCTCIVLKMFILCALYVIRYATNRFALNCRCSATILKFPRAILSRFFRLIRFHARFQSGNYFYSKNSNTIRDRRANVTSRSFCRGRTLVKDNYVASFIRDVRSHIRHNIMTSDNVYSVGIVISDSQRPSAERIGLLYGSADANRQAITSSGRWNIGTFFLRIIMDGLTTLKDHRLFTTNYLRSYAARLSSITSVLTFRFFSFTNCRAFMASVCAFG